LPQETKLIKVDPLQIEKEKEKIALAAQVLKNGGLVAFPTETVYGLGANGLDSRAVQRIFQVKGRPADNPLILHVASLEEAEKLVAFLPREAKILAEKFWPGPLTMVLPKKEHLPLEVTAGLKTVAIRVPSHPVALELIRQVGKPVAAPSANLSGKPSPTSAEHVVQDLAGKIDLLLDGGRTKLGLESTVLDLTGEVPLLLRPGGVTLEELRQVLARVVSVWQKGKELIPRSPGMKYTHYAPAAEVILVVGDEKAKVRAKIEQIASAKKGKKVGVMVVGKGEELTCPALIKTMGSLDNLEEVAANIYQLLREMDQLGMDLVLVEGVKPEGLGLAIMNRLERAAGDKIIQV